jgi:hypothetical protein
VSRSGGGVSRSEGGVSYAISSGPRLECEICVVTSLSSNMCRNMCSKELCKVCKGAPLYMCPHTTTYGVPLYMCPHTTTSLSSNMCRNMCSKELCKGAPPQIRGFGMRDQP